jgi:hypothetical protein
MPTPVPSIIPTPVPSIEPSPVPSPVPSIIPSPVMILRSQLIQKFLLPSLKSHLTC